MSSDSDQDAFFDADDETPYDSFSHPSRRSLSKNFTLSQIEEEERRLLHLKRIADERRRQEDEELERRLNQLQQRKRVECDSANRDPSSIEHEGRRKKLEEMRQSLGADRSMCSISTSHDSSVDNDSPNTSTDIADVFSMSGIGAAVAASVLASPGSTTTTTTKSHTIEKMENNGVHNTPSHKQHAKKRSGSWGDLPKNDSTSITVASLAAEFTRNMQMISAAGGGGGAVGDGAGASGDEDVVDVLGAGFGSGGGGGGRDRDGGRSTDTLSSGEGGLSDGSEAARAQEKKLSDLSLNMERYQPEKEKPNKSLTLLISGSKRGHKDLSTYSVVDTILQQTQVRDSEDCEPDIVKSTKSQRNTPPNTLKQPVAPPRRKKSTRNVPEASGLTPQIDGLPVPPSPLFYHREPPSPKLGGRESTLDVKSALEGNRFILTEDADRVPCSSSHPTPTTTTTTNVAGTDDPTRPSSSSLERFSSSSMGKPSSSSSSPTRSSSSVRRSQSAASSTSTASTGFHLRHAQATSNMSSQHSTIDNTAAGLDSLSAQIQHWQSMGDGEKEASPSRRPRSNSGRILSDEEILELVTVRNLDTGETIPLSSAEDKLPKCVNPLSLHIMKRIKEYASDTSLHVEDVSDQSDSKSEKSVASSSNNIRLKRKKISKFFGKTVNRVKNVADQALHSEQMPVEEEVSVDGKVFKIKSASRNKGPYDFSQPYLLQEMSGEHRGAIWTMKFSPCGKLLATGGQDSILRIWVLKSTYTYFEDFRQKYSDVRLSPADSHESLNSASSDVSASATMDPLKELNRQSEEDDINAPFRQRPFCVYKGHTADLLDLSWSKNYFVLSSSMDKTVRLWHISRRECLCTFQHIDFVTAIVFHPKDDRFFLSGSLDGKLRLWNIPDKKVTMWNELSGASNLITAANFCYNGRLAVVGTYDGKCIFYTTDQMKYYTMLNVRSSRGKNSKGRKITGIEVMPGEDKILVTSNDSRIRLYNLKDCTLSCKYKGCMNNSSQIRANFSSTGKYVISGSEDHFLYVWKTHHEFLKFTSARRDRNIYWEAIKIHNAIVTSAIFAPNPSFIFRMAEQESMGSMGKPLFLEDDMEEREIIVSADFTGAMKIMTNRSYRAV